MLSEGIEGDNMPIMTNILYLLANLFRTYVIFMLCSSIWGNFKGNRKYEFMAYMPFYVIVSAVYLISKLPVLNIVTNFAGLFFTSLFYDEKWKRRLWGLLMSYAIPVAVEIAVVMTFSERMFSVWEITIIEYDVLYLCLTDIIFFIIAIVIRYRAGRRAESIISEQFGINDWLMLLLIPVYVIYILLLLFSSGELRKSLIIVSSVLSLLVILLVFYLYEEMIKRMQDRLDKKKLEDQNRYYENQLKLMQEAEDRVRTLRHDMKNHMLAIENMVSNGEVDMISGYIQDFIGLAQGFKEYSKTGIVACDSMLNYKLSRFEEKGVSVKADIVLPKGLALKNNEWTIILGNLLDNASEALEKMKDNREITVELKYTYDNLIIFIRNTYNSKIHFENGNLQTNKQDSINHGLGLKSVKSVVEANDGSMSVNYDENFFEVRIIIPGMIGDV